MFLHHSQNKNFKRQFSPFSLLIVSRFYNPASLLVVEIETKYFCSDKHVFLQNIYSRNVIEIIFPGCQTNWSLTNGCVRQYFILKFVHKEYRKGQLMLHKLDIVDCFSTSFHWMLAALAFYGWRGPLMEVFNQVCFLSMHDYGLLCCSL